MRSKKNTKQSYGSPIAHALLLFACIAWGGSYAVGRFGLNDGSALWLTIWRWGPSAILFAAYLTWSWKRLGSSLIQGIRPIIILSLLGIVIYPATLFRAVAETTALNASLYLAATPVLIILGSVIIWKENVSPAGWCAVALGFIGSLVLLFRGEWGALVSFKIATSDLWAIVSAIVWTGYCTAIPLKPKRLSEMEFLAALVVTGTIVLVMLGVVYAPNDIPLPDSPKTAWAMAYFAIFPSILAFFAWNRATSTVGPTIAAPYNNLVPLLGGVLGVVFLGETIENYHFMGGGLIIAGLLLNATT